MRVVSTLIAVLLIIPGASLRAQEWTDWQRILPEDSHFGFSLPEGTPSPSIERSRSVDRQQSKQELWSWESGGFHAFILDDFHYMQRLGKEDLIASIGNWSYLTEIGITATKNDVKRSKNKLGNYYYVEAKTPDGRFNCFVFLQNLRATNPGGYEEAAGTVASGIVNGFDCQDGQTATLVDHEKLMKTYMSGLRRQ